MSMHPTNGFASQNGLPEIVRKDLLKEATLIHESTNFSVDDSMKHLAPYAYSSNAIRLRHTLNQLFESMDSTDSIGKRESDVKAIKLLLPHIPTDKIRKKVLRIGNFANRRSIVLRQLLPIGENSRKRKWTDTPQAYGNQISYEPGANGISVIPKKRERNEWNYSNQTSTTSWMHSTTSLTKANMPYNSLVKPWFFSAETSTEHSTYNGSVNAQEPFFCNRESNLTVPLQNPITNLEEDRPWVFYEEVTTNKPSSTTTSDVESSVKPETDAREPSNSSREIDLFRPSTSSDNWFENAFHDTFEDEEYFDYGQQDVNMEETTVVAEPCIHEDNSNKSQNVSNDIHNNNINHASDDGPSSLLAAAEDTEHMARQHRKSDEIIVVDCSTPLLGPSNLEPDLFSFEPGPSSLQPSRSSLEPGPSSPQPGPSTSARSRSDKIDDKLYYAVLEMFPDTCPNYIKSLCRKKTYCPKTLDDITTTILSDENHPKREREPSPEVEVDPEQQLEFAKQVLPDADPTYLRLHVDRLANNPEEFKTFLMTALETKKYPTMQEYIRKQQLSAQVKQLTTEFSVEKFIETIPDPESYFCGKNRKTKADTTDVYSYHYALIFLKNYFNKISVGTITNKFTKGSSLVAVFKSLEKLAHGAGTLKSTRKSRPMPEGVTNIPLLQEVAYLQHRQEIILYLKQKQIHLKQEEERMKQLGLMKTCQCCYDDNVLPSDTFTCEKGCEFCKPCVERSVEVAYADGKVEFMCLADCDSHFSIHTLQQVLKPKLFSKLAQKKQLEEVKAAGIEDLESCPFCDFATIPAPGDKLFHCLNPECMKQSCRNCKEPSHIPLRCEEVEKDSDVEKRTYIENKMTEALLRKCYKCGLKFIKEDGCNKMTCQCGAMMCYVCGQPVQDYKHFNGQGGDQYHLCPLYSDTVMLHQEAVLRGAEEAKKEIGINNPNDLKIDPTVDVVDHFKEMAKKAKPPPNPRLIMMQEAAIQAHIHRNNLLEQLAGEMQGRQPPFAYVRRHQHRHHRHD